MQSIPTLLRVLSPILLLAFLLPSAPAAEYHVSPTGSDSASGAANAPWKTLKHAASKVAAGDTVLVAPGDYPDIVTIGTSGNANQPIHFKSATLHQAKVGGFKLEGDYITIEGFTISNDRANGFAIHAGEAHRENARKGCKMLNNAIHGIKGTAIFSGTEALVSGNEIRNVYRGIFVNSDSLVENNEIDTLVPEFVERNGKQRPKKTQYCFYVGENITFRNNYLHGTEKQYLIEGMGVCFFTSYDAWIFGSSKNILIEGNRCFNATHASEPTATALKDSSDITYRNNLFVDTVYVGVLPKYYTNITVENNTFINCGAYPIWLQSPREHENAVIRNNLIAYVNRDHDVSTYGWKAAESGIRANLHPQRSFVSENNLLWGTNNREYSKSDFTGDPLFVDPANHDYRLRPGSPAIDAGATIPAVKTDFRGVPRPQLRAYDIGFYEYDPKNP